MSLTEFSHAPISGVEGPFQDLEAGQAFGREVSSHHLPVLPVGFGIARVAGREQPGQGGVLRPQQLTELLRQLAQQGPLGRRQPQLEPASAGPADAREDPRHGAGQESFCMVAHRPCACSREVSNSAFSLAPEDTMAFPL